MKKHLFALLALVALLTTGCPTGPVDGDLRTDATVYSRGGNNTDLVVVDAARSDTLTLPDATAPHRLGSFNPTCTSGGVPFVVSGVQNSACTTVLPIANGGTALAAVPGNASEVMINSAGAYGTATNVTGGTAFLGIGASPVAGTGNIRFTNGADIRARNAANSADIGLIGLDAANTAYVGCTTAQTLGATLVAVFSSGTGSVWLGSVNGAAVKINNNTNVISSTAPYIGEASVYGVHGKVTDATAPPFTLASASYKYDAIMLSNAGAGTVTFPAPGTDAGAYYKTVINTGAGTKTLTDGGASTPTLAVNLSGRYLFDTAGVHLTGPSVAYP